MNGFIHISHGGPMRKISVGSQIYEFEMHPYCGPNVLNRHGEPLKNQPRKFLEAASLWAQQGQRVGDDGLCVYEVPGEPITQHIVGRHHRVIGHTSARRGD